MTWRGDRVQAIEVAPDLFSSDMVSGKDSFLNSHYWLQYLSASDGASPRPIHLMAAEGFVGRVVLDERLIMKSARVGRLLNGRMTGFGSWGRKINIGDGLDLCADEWLIPSLQALTRHIVRGVPSRGYLRARVQVNFESRETALAFLRQFRALAPHRKALTATSVVSLKPSNSAILLENCMSRSTRRSAARARAEGISIVRIAGPRDFRDLFMPAIRKSRPGMRSPTDSEIEEVFSLPWHDEVFRYFVAIHPKIGSVATLGTVTFGLRATEILSSVSRDSRAWGAQEVLHLEAMRLAAEVGCTEFDLAGVDIDSQSGEVSNQGISAFKRKFRGELRFSVALRLGI